MNPVHIFVGLAVSAVFLAALGRLAQAPGARQLAALVFFGGLFTVGFAACAIMAAALWPEQVQRTQRTLASKPLRCWLVGLVILLAQGLVVLEFTAGPIRFVTLAVFIVLDLVLLAQGLPAAAALVGERVGVDSRPKAVAAGSLLFAATGILPVVGWLLGGTLLVQALGAAVLPAQPAPAQVAA